MPVFVCGIESERVQEEGQTPPYIETLHLLTERADVTELFLHANAGYVEAFAVGTNHDEFQQEFLALLQEAPFHSAASSKPYRIEGFDAVDHFYRRACGIGYTDDYHQDNQLAIESFRKSFMRARKANFTGPYFNKLFQRGLWLSEKIRMDRTLEKQATNVEAVIPELAKKIFGDLNQHSALVASASLRCDSYVKKLSENVGNFLFVDLDHDTTETLCARYSGELIKKEALLSALQSVDLVLLFNEKAKLLLNDISIRKMMSERNNAPLLIVSTANSFSNEANQEFSKYNVYFYDKTDLERIASSNLREHRKVNERVDKLLSREVVDFIDWVNSDEPYRFGHMIGKSEAMQQVMELVARISQTDISVLIDGESGTGKELVARSIHEHSRRAEKPFVVVNCGAIPDGLLESELFGHVRGAFTSATSNKKGLFEVANEGTIFLDEIGEMSSSTQVKLLRFLQEGEIRPVGSNQNLYLDVRVIAATNRDLDEMVADGDFRQDLYYRLNVIQITVPPLRDRKEDIVPLIDFFVKKYAKKLHRSVKGVSEGALDKLRTYHWPGNVRELENAIERAVALSVGEVLNEMDFPGARELDRSDTNSYPVADVTLKELERRHIKAMLQEHNWNYDLVTQILGIGRTTLWRKMKEYNISSQNNGQSSDQTAD